MKCTHLMAIGGSICLSALVCVLSLELPDFVLAQPAIIIAASAAVLGKGCGVWERSKQTREEGEEYNFRLKMTSFERSDDAIIGQWRERSPLSDKTLSKASFVGDRAVPMSEKTIPAKHY